MRAAVALLSISWLCILARAHISAPIQLLVPDKNRTGLAVVESALEMIERIEGPVAVVAITGACNTFLDGGLQTPAPRLTRSICNVSVQGLTIR